MRLGDRIKLLLAALTVIAALIASFTLADLFHVSARWVSLLGTSVVFFAAIGWDYRREFKSTLFILFFTAWLVIHLFVFVKVLTYFGWAYWIMAVLIELFFFYATAYWFFGLQPPPHYRGHDPDHG